MQAFVASLFLSACGIKGDLYQTPEQPVTEKEIADVDANKVQDDSHKSQSSENKPVVQQTLEQVSEKPTKPVVETVPERVKGANNVS